MNAFFAQYPYLLLSLLLLVGALLGLALGRGQRRAMLLGALLSTPYALFSPLFVPEYWRPQRLWEGFTGLEDLLFSLANGALAWLLAVWPLGRRLRWRPRPLRLIWRFFLWSLLGSLCGMALHLTTALGPMSRALISMSLVGMVLLVLVPRRWPLALAGGLGFTAVYGLLLALVVHWYPHFLRQWNPAVLAGLRPAGLPMEEMLWALGYGAVWPLLMADALEARESRSRILD